MTERPSPSRPSASDPVDEQLLAGGRVATDIRVVDGSEDGEEAVDAIAVRDKIAPALGVPIGRIVIDLRRPPDRRPAFGGDARRHGP